MCGIVFKASFDGTSINKDILDQFEKQQRRGIQGFGLYDGDSGHIYKTPKLRKAKKLVMRKPSTNILFHHRFPTSTANVTNACHPFSTKKFYMERQPDGTYKGKKYIFVHNGVVHNSRMLKLQHDERKIVYESKQSDGRFNDSEALMWDFTEILEGKQIDFKSRGSVAFICMEIDGDNKKLYFGRNEGNPLNMVIQEGKMISLSSEGDGDSIEPNTLYMFDYQTQGLTQKKMLIATDPKPAYTTSQLPAGGRSYHFSELSEAEQERRVIESVSRHYGIDPAEIELEDDDDLLGNGEGVVYAKRPNITGSVLKFIADEDIRIRRIKYRLTEYLNYANGYFQKAYDAMRDDYTEMEMAHFDWICDSSMPDSDLSYEMEVHRTAMDMLRMNPQWEGMDSRAKGYAEAKEEETQRKVPITERPAISEAKDGVQVELLDDNTKADRVKDAGAIAVAEFKKKHGSTERMKDIIERSKEEISKMREGSIGRNLLEAKLGEGAIV